MYWLNYPESFAIPFNVPEYLVLFLLEIVLRAVIEEMFFRMIIFNMLRYKKPIVRILSSAGIFALFELIGFFQTFEIVSTLIDMGMAFIIGIFLGFIREYTKSIYPCMVFHFLDLFLAEIFPALFFVFTDATLFMVLYFGLPVLALVYCGIIYLCYFKDQDDEVIFDVY